MAKAVEETATSANARVEGQRQPESAKEQSAEEFGVRSSCVIRFKNDGMGPLVKDRSGIKPKPSFASQKKPQASVLNTFTMVLIARPGPQKIGQIVCSTFTLGPGPSYTWAEWEFAQEVKGLAQVGCDRWVGGEGWGGREDGASFLVVVGVSCGN